MAHQIQKYEIIQDISQGELFYLLKRYLKEVTDEGLLEHNYAPIETPVEVVSPVVLEAIKPVEEEIELPQLAQPEEMELPALNGEQPKEELNPEAKQKMEELERQLDELLTNFTITDDRFELIENIDKELIKLK